MASLGQRGNRFRVIFRLGGQKHSVSVKAAERKDAEACLVRLEENLRLVERGRLAVPDGADIGLFLMSDGRLEKKGSVVRPVRLAGLFETYRTAFTAGAKEVIPRAMEDIHLSHLARLIGGETPAASITAGTGQLSTSHKVSARSGWRTASSPGSTPAGRSPSRRRGTGCSPTGRRGRRSARG